MIKNKEKFYSFLLAAIVAVALLTRIYLFFMDKSLWLDEAALGLNLLERNFLGLFQPLNYIQSAPPLFLILSKISMTIFGKNEWALRLFPFISSVLSVFAFKYLLDLILKNPLQKVMPLVIFTFSFPLLYNTVEFKPYIADVLFVILTFIIYLKFLTKNPAPKKEFALGMLLASFPLFSFGSIFAVSSVVLLSVFNKKKIMPGIITLGLLIEYFFIFSHLGTSSALFQWWYEYFIDYNLLKFFPVLIKIVQYHSYPSPLLLLPLILFFAGAIYLFKENKKLFALLLLPLLLGFLASFLDFYPLFGRLSLFLHPIFIILITYPLAAAKKTAVRNFFLGIALIFTFSIFTENPYDINLYKREEIKPLIKTLQNEIQKGDKVFVFKDSHLAWRFYDPKLKYDNEIYVTRPKDDPYEELNRFCKKSTCFVVFTTEIDREEHTKKLNEIIEQNSGEILKKENGSFLFKAVFK